MSPPSGSKKKKSRKARKKQQFKGKSIRNTRMRGRRSNDRLTKAIKLDEEDVLKMLAAQVHVGRRKSHVNMKRYIWKQRRDGFHVINLEKTWNKLVLAARILVAVKDPSDIVVMSTRTYGQRGAIKFAHHTGATSMVGKFVPGTFCNPKNKAYTEPRLLVVDDPSTCFAALRETSYVGIPVIAFCGVDNNTRFVDCAIPCNNRGKLSVGLMFWLLAREILRMRKALTRQEEWKESVDLFFYRDPDEIKKQQAKQAEKRKLAEEGLAGAGDDTGGDGGDGYGHAHAGADGGDAMGGNYGTGADGGAGGAAASDANFGNYGYGGGADDGQGGGAYGFQDDPMIQQWEAQPPVPQLDGWGPQPDLPVHPAGDYGDGAAQEAPAQPESSYQQYNPAQFPGTATIRGW